MKKTLKRILSTVLIIASLISCLTVFIYADNSSSGSETPAVDLNSIELLFNRNYEEGWDYTSGKAFSAISTHKSYIDYEETATYKYNYFWRFEASSSASSAFSNFDFATSRLLEGGTIVQFKIKADDACDVGKIFYIKTGMGQDIDVLFINGKTLYAFQEGAPQYKLADLTDDWLNVTLIFDWDATKKVGDGKCNTCGRSVSTKVCETCADEDLNGKCDTCGSDMENPCERCVDALGKTEKIFSAKVYYGNEAKSVEYTKDYNNPLDAGMKNLYFGIGGGGADKVGMSYCLDDLQIYQKTKIPVDLSGVEDKVSKVNTLADKVIDIQEGPGTKSTEEIINEALCMKVGVDSALVRNVKKSIIDYCTPTVVDGKVMISLKLLLEFIGYPYYVHPDQQSYDITTGVSATYITIGRDTATVDGERVALSTAPGYLKNTKGEDVPVIAVDDVPAIFPGWLLTYDDMGLVIIYEDQSSGEESDSTEAGALIHRDTDLDLMLTIMKKFIFDTVDTDENGVAFDEAKDLYIANGNKVIADVKANTSLAHPYIYANQASFDGLKAVYAALENADTKAQGYLQILIDKADAIYSSYAKLSESTGEYEGILEGKAPVNENSDGKNPDPLNKEDTTVADTSDGYSAAGTLEAIETYTAQLVDLAFAYQITGEEKYANLAYDLSIALGEWAHWGPGNIINCATATSNFAVAYDWLYNYYLEAKGQDAIDTLAGILYNKGVLHGYNSSADLNCEFPKAKNNADVYTTLANNWNAACSSGMIIGALALIGYDEYADNSAYLIGNNLQNLIACGLDQYAPDGSYAESALMWATGTNGFVKLIAALESAAGTTYGFEDTWGLDNTFYFACYIEDSDGKIWNYHEGGADGIITGEILGIDTQMFNYAGRFLGDSVLIAIRDSQIAKGKEVSIFDMLFYPTEATDAEANLALDYHMEGIHAFVSRSDWEDGALYTGIMGGANDVYGGQIDSGNFIYRNKGITWFMDLGSDNQELYDYFGNYRNRYYRNNAEGQNTVMITSPDVQKALPYGQAANGNGKITQTYVNEHGSYAILDNSSAYGSYVSYANRGMLVTNDRKTVVIQDEMSFKKMQEVVWVAHTAAEVEIYDEKGNPSDIGRTAYLTSYDENGRAYVLRATLASKILYFEASTDCKAGDVLSATATSTNISANGGASEYSRKGITRLMIRSGSTLAFNAAIVLEIVDGVGSDQEVGYEWMNMNTWEPVAEGTDLGPDYVIRGNAVKSDIRDKTSLLEVIKDRAETAYTTDIGRYYEAITLIEYTLKTFEPNDLTGNDLAAYSKYLDYYDGYCEYVEIVNEGVQANTNFALKLAGLE